MRDTTERLRCRCCGIPAPDVGFTIEGDLLCDACETALREHLADFAVRSMMRAVRRGASAAALAFMKHEGWPV